MRNLIFPVTNYQPARPAGGLLVPCAKRGYFRVIEKTSFPSKARGAYIALVSFLIVSAVVLVIGVTLAILGVSEAQMGLSEKRGHFALALAEGCAEDALLSSYYNGSYAGGAENYPEGSCIVGVVKDGNNWTIITTATASGHTKKIEVKINRGNEITITGWKEVE